MVSKSANYCHTSKSSPLGLMMLCDVALGNMHELKQADYITKLPKGTVTQNVEENGLSFDSVFS
jgi:hypothetical protein